MILAVIVNIVQPLNDYFARKIPIYSGFLFYRKWCELLFIFITKRVVCIQESGNIHWKMCHRVQSLPTAEEENVALSGEKIQQQLENHSITRSAKACKKRNFKLIIFLDVLLQSLWTVNPLLSPFLQISIYGQKYIVYNISLYTDCECKWRVFRILPCLMKHWFWHLCGVFPDKQWPEELRRYTPTKNYLINIWTFERLNIWTFENWNIWTF